jgi:hypothetical protein
MYKKYLHVFIILLIVALLLIGCKTPQPNNEIQSTKNLAGPTTYPIASQDQLNDQSYPMGEETKGQESSFPKSIEIPTPLVDSGIVTGKILIEGSREPYLGANLFLGEVVDATQPGYPPLIGYSENSDPKAVIAQDGSFLFLNIKPGRYGIVMVNPLSANLIQNLDTGDTLIITVEAGKENSLGELFVK